MSSKNNEKEKTNIHGNVEKLISIGIVHGDVIISGKDKSAGAEKNPETGINQASTVLDEVFNEIFKSLLKIFNKAQVNRTIEIDEIIVLKRKLIDLKHLGVEHKQADSLDCYISGINELLGAYNFIFTESHHKHFHESLADKLEKAANSFQESKTNIGMAFSSFFIGWALIKRTKKLYSDPSQMDIVITRHKQQIPEFMITAKKYFEDFPMGSFSLGEASYSTGWAYVFEALNTIEPLLQAKLIDQAADHFKLAANYYSEAKLDSIHELIAESDHDLFKGIAFSLLSQRQDLKCDALLSNLKKACDFLTDSIIKFLKIKRIELACAILKLLLILKNEVLILEGGPSKEKNSLNEILELFFANEQYTVKDVFERTATNIIETQGISRMPEMLLSSQIFIDAISIIRKNDQEDLEKALLSTASPQIPLILNIQSAVSEKSE